MRRTSGERYLGHSERPVALSHLLLACLTLALIVAGCSGGTGPRAQANARFEPSILADGTKLFTYTIDLPPQPAGQIDRLGSGDRPMRMDRLVEEVLAENNYCRQGWLMIDSYQTLRIARARGECKEAASTPDRERYTK